MNPQNASLFHHLRLQKPSGCSRSFRCRRGRSLGHSQVDRQRRHNVEFIVHVSPLDVWLTRGDTVQAALGGNQQIQGEDEKQNAVLAVIESADRPS